MLKKLAFLLFILLTNICWSQSVDQQIDSLLNLIKNEKNDSIKADHYFSLVYLQLYEQPLQCIANCHKGLSISTKIQDHQYTSNFYVQAFNAHLYYGSPADSLLKTVKLLEEHTINNRSEEDLVRTYWLYALYYSNLGVIDKQIEYYIEALKIQKEHFDQPEMESGLLGNIGGLLLDQERYDEALEYIRKGLALTNDNIAKGVFYSNLTTIYSEREEYDSVKQFVSKSYQYFEKGGDLKGMATSLMEEGILYDNLNQFERANQLYNQSLNLIEKNNIGSLLPTIFLQYSNHYKNRKDFNAAVTYSERALSEMKEQQNYANLSSVYDNLHQSYAALGDYKKAFEIKSEQMTYKDSVSNTELLTKVEMLRTEFEVEQKETENELLKAETAANRKTIQSRNITALSLLLGLLLLGSWALLVFRSNQQKQKYNEELEAEVAKRTHELNKANKNLEQANYELKTFNYIASHDIKEPIRNIGSYAGLVYQKLPNELKSDFKAYFDTIKGSTSQLYTLVEDFSRYTQMSKDDEIELQSVDLNVMLDSLEMSFQSFLTEKNARIINEGLPTINTSSYLIYTILKNLVENGLKFNQSPVPTVYLNSKTDNHFIYINVKDNGIGIEEDYQQQIFEMFKRLHHREEYQGSGIGLAIVKLLLEKLNGEIKVQSKLGQGSTFSLKIPKNK